MLFRNTPDSYGAATKTFHWLTALIVIALLGVGLYMGGMEAGASKIKVYNLHKSFGICVLALAVLRIFWHVASKKPDFVGSLTVWEKRAARAVHLLLYFLIIAMPLTGWLMSSAYGRSVGVFGLFTLPDLMEQNQELGKSLRELHGIFGWALMFVAGAHFLAALKHHFVNKDATLRRMLPLLAIAVFVPFAAYAAQVPAAPVWDVVEDKTSISFKGVQMGKEFSGSFGKFDAHIYFDPDNLAESAAAVDIDIASVTTADKERDSNIVGKEWFDTAQFPKARFATTGFRKTAEGGFEADGTLTIRNISIPLVLPFTLTLGKDENGMDTAEMHATVTLDRSKFALGTGEWADVSIIANEVTVEIGLMATKNSAPVAVAATP